MATEHHQDPFLAREIGAELANIAHYKREAERASGVRYSGLEAAPFKARTVAEIQADADKARERAAARARSPRGIFVAAVHGVAEMPTFEHDAGRLLDLYSRSLADDRLPLNVAAVGAALAILNEIPGKDARRAIDALAELLMQARKEAA